MKPCAKGAIVNKSEINRLLQAIDTAIEATLSDQSSNRVPNPRDRTAADRDLEKAWKGDLRNYRSLDAHLWRCLRPLMTVQEIQEMNRLRKLFGRSARR